MDYDFVNERRRAQRRAGGGEKNLQFDSGGYRRRDLAAGGSIAGEGHFHNGKACGGLEGSDEFPEFQLEFAF